MGKGWKTRCLLLILTVCTHVGGIQADDATDNLGVLVQLLGTLDDPAVQRDLLQGIQDALRGRREVAPPAGWKEIAPKLARSPDANVRRDTLALSVLFGDPAALKSLRQQAADAKMNVADRTLAIQLLVQKQDKETLPLLKKLVADNSIRGAALRGLSAYDDPQTPEVILEHYATMAPEQKGDAIATLASRASYLEHLLTGLESGKIPRRDVSAFTIRQLMQRGDKNVNARLEKSWGTVRSAAAEKGPLIQRFKQLLTMERVAKADPAQGRLVFTRTCSGCHVLFGEGKKVGPELTGSQRTNLDYVLENLIDPSALVGKDYQMTSIETESGRLITGLVIQENADVVTVRTANDTIFVPRDEIEDRVTSAVSMMPEGLLTSLKEHEVLDLVRYLASPAQVDLPPQP